MAVLSFTDCEILAGPFRLTGRSNAVELETTRPALDVTNFDSGGWNESIAGIKEMAASVDGHYDASAIETGGLTLDEQLFAELSSGQFPLTLAPTKTDGGVAYVAGAQRGSLTMFGQIGEVAPFSSDMWGDGQVGRGNLIHPASSTVSATADGNGVQLGAVADGDTLLMSYHVLSLDGTTPTIDITFESDDNSGFASAATVHNTGALSTATSALVTAAGPITDDYFRVTFTLGGTDPVIRFAAAIATSTP